MNRALAFLSNHKKKFIALALVGFLGVGAFYYAKKLLRDSLAQANVLRTKLKLKQRKEQELQRLKLECTTTILTFLPPLRRQLNRLTDPRPVTMQLKELRARQKARGRDQTSKEEDALMDRLWEDLKVLSLARLAASVYSLSLMDLLLRVQLHVAARVVLEEGQDVVSQKVREQFMFKATDFFVGQGLHTLLERVTKGIRAATKAWQMGTDATVTRSEIIDMVGAVRREIEEGAGGGMSRAAHAWFLSCLIQPDEALARARQDAGLDDVRAQGLKKMLDETMDLLESPHFAAVLEEALTRLFSVLLDELHARQFEGVRKPAVSPTAAAAATPAALDERFILAKVIVGMKLVASDVLATGDGDDGEEDKQQPAQASGAAAGQAQSEANKYVRELETMAALNELCKTILGLSQEDMQGLEGLDGLGTDEMKALTGLLAGMGGGGQGGGAGAGAGGLDMGALLSQMLQAQESGAVAAPPPAAGPRLTMVE